MNTINLDHKEIAIEFHHKKTKHSYVRVKSPGVVHVTVGKNATKKRMVQYIKEHQETILRSIKKYQQETPYQLLGVPVKKVYTEHSLTHYDEITQTLYLPKNNPEEHLKQFEKNLMIKTIKEMLETFPHTNLINIKDISIHTRYTTTVHGSCNARKKRINLNLYLVRRKKAHLHYVLMHELAHLNVQNHSKDFYDVLKILCPNYQQIKRDMKQT